LRLLVLTQSQSENIVGLTKSFKIIQRHPNKLNDFQNHSENTIARKNRSEVISIGFGMILNDFFFFAAWERNRTVIFVCAREISVSAFK